MMSAGGIFGWRMGADSDATVRREVYKNCRLPPHPELIYFYRRRPLPESKERRFKMYNRSLIAKYAPSALTSGASPAVSDRYAHINTADVIEQFGNDGWLVVKATQNAVRDDISGVFTRHELRLRHVDSIMGETKVGDLFPEIVAVNSHDRSSAFRLHAGFFRKVCSNGLVIAEKGIQDSFSIRHLGHDVIEMVKEGVTWVQKRTNEAIRTVNLMQSRMLTDSEAREFARRALELYTPDPIGYDLNSMLAVRREGDVDSSLWTVFNRVQESLMRGGIRRSNPIGRNSSTVGITSITRGIDLNKELWAAAEEMIEA